MSGPAYHLRVNKAADRFALIEAIRYLDKLGGDLDEFTYHGLGGPYLEDIRLLYEHCPEISMVSVEENPDICKRQDFHLPCGTLNLVNSDVSSYITQYQSEDKKSIFWLDYTGLRYTCFEDFITLLRKVTQGSMIKITLRANPWDYWYFPKKGKQVMPRKYLIEPFRKEFERILGSPSDYPPWKYEDFARFVQQMLQMATMEAFPAISSPLSFHPVSSFYYSDGTWMFTLTGIIWPRNENEVIENAFNNWEFANLNWGTPRLIDIPNLSTKERLHLQRYLPCNDSPGSKLREKLGYLVEEDVPTTEAALKQYAAFHRYFPYFLRGVP